MHTQDIPHTRRARPHRIVVNVDSETLQGLRALAYAGETSLSFVASDALRLLLPTIRPVVEAMAEIRTAPAVAMEKLSLQADAVAEMARGVVHDMRSAQRCGPTLPSSNTGG